MKKAKIVIICFYLLYRVGMLVTVYLTQGFSEYFVGNQYLEFSLLSLSPVFVLGALALIRLSRENARVI
jgi:hypothetical protein